MPRIAENTAYGSDTNIRKIFVRTKFFFNGVFASTTMQKKLDCFTHLPQRASVQDEEALGCNDSTSGAKDCRVATLGQRRTIEHERAVAP